MNAAREIADSLRVLREGLENMEIVFDNSESKLIVRNSRNERTDLKLEDLFKKQTEITNFNISGKIFPVNSTMLLECEYENVLTNLLHEFLDTSRDLLGINAVVLDRNPKHFKTIIDIIRKRDDMKKQVSDFYRDKLTINFLLPSNINIEVFKQDLQYYFRNNSYDKLFDDFKFTYKVGNTEKILYGSNTNLTQFIELFHVSAEYPNELLVPYKAVSMDDIKSQENYFKAIFTDYDANVIFTFVEPVKATYLALKPFWGDLDCWYPGDGAGAFVYYSMDKTNWEFLTALPVDYGCDMGLIHEMFFDEKEIRYLKIEVKEYALSISYIKVA